MNHLSIRCGILGHALVSGDAGQVAAWRANPGSLPGRTWPHGMLKQSEDQTIVSLVALLDIIQNKQISESELAKWGVIAGPLFLARAALSAAFAHFGKEGAWGVSPHLIPHRFLHSVSGTLSLALGMHGPNFGVGGGTSSHLEAVTMGCLLARNTQSGGVWLVLTGYDPDRLPEPSGNPNSPWRCHALVLALVPAHHPQSEHMLLVTPQAGDSACLHTVNPMRLIQALAAALNSSKTDGAVFSARTGQFILHLAKNDPVSVPASQEAA